MQNVFNTSMLCAALTGFVAIPAGAGVLIDYDDGLANGIHDASIANGGFEDSEQAGGRSLAAKEDADNSAGDIPGFYYSYFAEATAGGADTDADGPEVFLWDTGGNPDRRSAVTGFGGIGGPADRRQLMIVPDASAWTIADGDKFHLEFDVKEGNLWDNGDQVQVRLYAVDKSSGYSETELTVPGSGGAISIDVNDDGSWSTATIDFEVDYDGNTAGYDSGIDGQQIGIRIFGSGARNEFAILDNFYLTATPVPEPGSLVLVAMGGLAVCGRRHR